jgi:RNA polymerase sigma-70 factor, ECF subfamily
MSAGPAFEELVKLYYHDLYRFGFSLTGSEADACDLTQETFYVWARKGHQLRNSANVKTWLFTTLYREFLRICRRQKRFPHETINETVQDLPHVPAACVEQLDAQMLLSLLGELADDYRSVLVLYYVEDLSYKEIAEVLAVPLGTVQSRIARAKVQLLRRLTETQFTPEGNNK